ncbi:MAG: phosphatidylinositol kinase, partial [Mycobacteriaceae bacterium]
MQLLRLGTMEVAGRIVEASNATLLCTIELDGVTGHCVYKPIRGERPLWDFPDGTLAGREIASYLISAATGWNVLPPTVFRGGPFGDGMVQLWVETSATASTVGDAEYVEQVSDLV